MISDFWVAIGPWRAVIVVTVIAVATVVLLRLIEGE